MRLTKALLCLSALLVLGGCDGEPDPTPDAGNPPDAGPSPAQLTKVTVSCEPPTVVVGGATKCTANATDQYGAPFTVSGYTWKSSDVAVAKVVDAEGNTTTGPNTGAVTITASATSGQVTQEAQATLTVNPVPTTVHATDITTNETWRAAENIHVVRGSLAVTGTLTLEPGVEVRFEQDGELRVTTGALKALGTQAAPIRMVAPRGATGSWRGVVFSSAASASELSYVTLSDCGHASGKGACIMVENKAAPVLRHVTVQNSATAGVVVADDGSAFGSESTVLSVSGSKGYAVRIGANQAGTLPTGGAFQSNTPNAVELRGNVSRTQTWPNLGIPYVVATDLFVHGPPQVRATLTLPAGTVLRFASNTTVYVGENGLGDLLIDGTAASPVLLTADSNAPQPGHWGGVHLSYLASNASRLSHATIEYGGAQNLMELPVNLDVLGTTHPVITNLVLQKSSEYGVVIDYNAGFGPGSTGLTVRDNGNYALWVPADRISTLPTGATFSGNNPNAVKVNCCGVTLTQTWPNLGIPYDFVADLKLGSQSSPKLTLLPGTQLRFAQGVDFQVGRDHPGSLIADGTAEAPIRFVPTVADAPRGHWRGIHLWQANGTKLNHVLVTHAGAEGSIGRGNVNLYGEFGPVLTNSSLQYSSLCALTFSNGTHGPTTTTDPMDPNYNNTYTNNFANGQCAN